MAGWVTKVLRVARGAGRPVSMGCTCMAGGCKCNGPAGCIGTATIFCRGTPQGRYQDPGWCCIVWSIKNKYSLHTVKLAEVAVSYHCCTLSSFQTPQYFFIGRENMLPHKSRKGKTRGAQDPVGQTLSAKVWLILMKRADVISEHSRFSWTEKNRRYQCL
jgi:hypothetical protein